MSTETIGWLLLGSASLLQLYTWAGYPLVLMLLRRRRGQEPVDTRELAEWPMVSISLPAYNEETQIRGAIESLLALDYPADRRQIVVISDGSTDGTDAIVQEYADRGVELLQVPNRAGKTHAEMFAAPHLRGEIVVNTDASIRVLRQSLKHLVAPFRDPTVGVVSSRDVSVGRDAEDPNVTESGYVGYEMQIRRLETLSGGIVGASGSGYAIRAELHREPLPSHLSRDFASALIARDHGFRAVSEDAAVCLVPRTHSMQSEYRRKVRTIARGMETLWFKRHLLDPFRHGSFAWKLWSHKVCRWLVPWSAFPAAAGIILLATVHTLALIIACGSGLVFACGLIAWKWPPRRQLPRAIAMLGFAVAANFAVLHATINALKNEKAPTWEPTRREVQISGH